MRTSPSSCTPKYRNTCKPVKLIKGLCACTQTVKTQSQYNQIVTSMQKYIACPLKDSFKRPSIFPECNLCPSCICFDTASHCVLNPTASASHLAAQSNSQSSTPNVSITLSGIPPSSTSQHCVGLLDDEVHHFLRTNDARVGLQNSCTTRNDPTTF